MGETQEGILSGLTVKSIALGVILAIFNIWIIQPYGTLAPSWIAPYLLADNNYGETAMWTRILPRVFLPLGIMIWACMIMLLINKARPNTFTLQEAATVFMITFCAGYLVPDYAGLYGLGFNTYSIPTIPGAFVHYLKDPEVQAEMFALVPSMFANQAVATYEMENVIKVNTGVWSINMAYWGGVLAWSWTYYLGQVLMFVGLANLLRKQFVEVEALGFPFATLFTDVVQISQPSSSKLTNILKNKWFIIGFVVMAVWSFGLQGEYMFNNRAQIQSRQYMQGIGRPLIPYMQPAWQWDTPYPLLENGGNFAYNLWPFFIGMMYLLPMGELAGGLVGSAILFIWMWTAFSSGIAWIYQGKTTGTWSSIDNPLHFLLDRWWMVQFGFLLGIVLIPLIRHRDLVIAQWKGLFQEQDDPNKPVSSRISWLLMLAGLVLLIISGSMLGIHLGVWILFIIGCAIISVGLIRFVSANGGFFFNSWKCYWDAGWWSYIGLPLCLAFGVGTGLSWETLITLWVTVEGDIGRVLWGAVISAILTLTFFKMGKQTKTKERTVFVACLIGLALGAILLGPFNAMLQTALNSNRASSYWLGMNLNNFWQNMKKEVVPIDAFFKYAGVGGNEVIQSPEYSLLAMAIGFVIILVFTLLRQRFSWMIVTTTGIMLGTMFGSELWLPILVALVFKYLTLRVGGTTRYENAGKPLAVGFLGGTAFVFVIQVLVMYAGRLAVGGGYPL